MKTKNDVMRKNEARARAMAREIEVAAAHGSADEIALSEAGYALIRDGNHRILSGIDDGSKFSVRIPLHRRTIREALDWLRPDCVPVGSLRQGKFFFLPCNPEREGISYTSEGSSQSVKWVVIESFDMKMRHMPDECIAVTTSGRTMFFGLNSVQSHDWEARTRIYAKGRVKHPEHTTLDLGGRWHEVIPNRAVAPWGVRQFSGGID